MATFGEIAHAIQDFSKTISDDSVITLEHIMFLMSKYRNYILQSANRKLTQADYQTICVEVGPGNDDEICGTRPHLESSGEVPLTLGKGEVSIAPPAGFLYGYRFVYVNHRQIQFVGHNKHLYGLIYVTIGPDGRMYITGNNLGFMHLKKVRMTAIFDDVMKVTEMECDKCCDVEICDIEDREFPMEASLLPLLMQYVTKEITGAAWNPRDDKNNANDDLSALAQVLQRYTNSAFKRALQGANKEGGEQ